MKILILGGSRFLGKAFIEEAKKENHEITIFNRGTQNGGLKDVEILIGDRNEPLTVLENRSWDAVLDTSGFVPRAVRNSTELLKDRVGHYTFISSISVYKDWIPEGLTEDYHLLTMPIEQADEISKASAGPFYEYYGQFKALCEQEAVRNMSGNVLNVRAGQLVGQHDYTDRFPYWINRVAKGGKILAPGNPQRKIQYIDNIDLAKWILHMMEKKLVGTFNTTGPDTTVTMEEFLDTAKKVTGSDAEFIWADEKFLLEHKVEPWTEMPLWVPENFPFDKESDQPWKGTFSININKALSKSLTFRPLEETINDIHEWDSRRNLPENEWKAGITANREKEILELLSSKSSSL